MRAVKPYSRRAYIEIVTALIRGDQIPSRAQHYCEKPQWNTLPCKFPVLDELAIDEPWWFGDLQAAVRGAEAAELVDDAIVHGSYGDGSSTYFSDLELTILVNERVFKSNEKQRALSRWIKAFIHPLLLRIDPLQHHGAFYLWGDLIRNYNQAILPLSAYSSSWSINGAIINFSNSPLSRHEQKEAFFVTLLSLLSPRKHFFRYGINPYSVKRVLSNFALLPAFYYQALGEPISKRAAIERIKQEGSDSISEALMIAARIRDEWKAPPRWLTGLRKPLARRQIPGGRADVLAASLYREDTVQKTFTNNFLPILPEACRTLKSLFENGDR